MTAVLLPLWPVLAVAAAWDLRARRIPDWLTLPAAAAGLLIQGRAQLPAFAAASLLALALAAAGLWGGGDGKLFAALGAWLPLGLWHVVFLVAVWIAGARVVCLRLRKHSGARAGPARVPFAPCALVASVLVALLRG